MATALAPPGRSGTGPGAGGHHGHMDVFDDLAAEDERLDRILAALDDDAWRSPSGAPGWSVADVVLHLAQTDEAVVASAGVPVDGAGWPADATGVDDAADRMVREQRAEPAEVFARWRAAQQASLSALRDRRPRHAAPVGGGLAQAGHAGHHPPGRALGPRARHHGTPRRSTSPTPTGCATSPGSVTPPCPTRSSLEGEQPHPIYCRLTGPSGDTWTFGPEDAESSIVGLAGSFCRVGAHRLAPEDAALLASGPYGPTALRVLRNYAA